MNSISKRAQKFLETPPAQLAPHFACQSDPFNPKANPEGYVNFGTAENYLLWDLLESKLNSLDFPSEELCHYQPMFGTHSLRTRVAKFMGAYAGVSFLDPEQIIVAAGCSVVLDMITYSLCNPGEAILIPTPYYPGFDSDLKAKAEAKVIPIPLSSAQNFALTANLVSETLQTARARGDIVKALLISSPNNPLGQVYEENLLRELIELTARENIQLIVDEIYAHSVFGKTPFKSALGLMNPHPKHVHTIYGMAKDFGLSGFKVGFLHSLDTELIAAMRMLCLFGPVSTHTQTAIEQILSDEPFTQNLLSQNRARLREKCAFTRAELAKAEVPTYPAEAGVFVWADFSKYLTHPTAEAEKNLAEILFKKGKVNISPGHFFHAGEPGWFRICYSYSEARLGEGLRRIARVLDLVR